MAKRYYWLKLKDDFFESKRIKRLRKIAGGDTYTIIYLKMQLKALKTEGYLYYDGLEETFAQELALDIDEDPDNVAFTLNYLFKCGLLETTDDVEFRLPWVAELTGSETAAAQRMRDMRDRKRNNVTPMLQTCYAEQEQEKEIEIEIDNRVRASIEDMLTPQEREFLEQTYKNIEILYDCIDRRGNLENIKKPLNYIVSIANQEGWKTY